MRSGSDMLKEITFTENALEGLLKQEWIFRINSQSNDAWLHKMIQQGETYKVSLEDVPERYKEAIETMGYEVQER